MMTCKKCGIDLTNEKVQEGYSKKINPKTGQPFGAYKFVGCVCGNREFLPKAHGAKQEVFQGTTQAPHVVDNTSAKLGSIHALLVKMDAKIDAIVAQTKKELPKFTDMPDSPEEIVWEE